jgi:hypothetical protein
MYIRTMTFKHPNFEFKLVEYPSTDGRPYYTTEAARDELELAKGGVEPSPGYLR